MAHMLARTAAVRGRSPALVDEAGSLTWSEFDARVNRLIHAMRAAGIQPRDRVAIYAGNSRTYFEVMAAAHHMGVHYVPVNWHFTDEELAYVVENSEARALVTDARFVDIAAAALARNDALAPALRIVAGAEHPAFTNLDALLAAQPADEPADQCVGGPMFYTSGTTGRPKGVTSAQQAAPPPIASLEMLAGGMSMMLGIPADGITLLAGPVYHSAQWAWSFLPLLAGSCVVMRHKFDAAETLELMDRHQVTNVHLVPTQFRRLLRVDDAQRKAFSGTSLQAVWHGAAPCPPEIKRQMLEWWGPVISEYYGSTEGSVVTRISAEEWLQRPGSVGKATPMVEVRIVKDDGTLASANESGTIYMKNLMGTRFEYHKDPDKTKAAYLEPGVFTTGDIGYLDDEGYLYMSDRKIDMIISGGVNIYPAEIESVLVTHPQVHEAAVFGVPNDEFGEEVKAVVELVPGNIESDALAQELIALCRTHLAGYKTPRSVEFRGALPRTETGKLQKRLLRDPYWEGLGRKI